MGDDFTELRRELMEAEDFKFSRFRVWLLRAGFVALFAAGLVAGYFLR